MAYGTRWRAFAAGTILGVVVAAVAIGAPAQERPGDVAVPSAPASPAPDVPRTFGTASEVAYVVSSVEFGSEDRSFPDDYDTNFSPFVSRYCIVAGCRLLAPVHLPAGAVVARIEVDGCDTNAGAGEDLQVNLHRVTAHEGSSTSLAQASTSGAPGCVTSTGILTTPETIDNQNNTYFLVFRGHAADSSVRIQATRLFYTLQVSPAPAVASFQDVPTTHPFFRFVEALKASGITGGCQASPPLFCPDDPLTRGQMATFLSIGLGLQFAP